MSTDLLIHRKDIYSQAGQDGIIEHIFDSLKIKNGRFVEFGAWDGIHLSNCRKLFEEGWSGVFIEADSKKFTELQKNYAGAKKVLCLNKKVEIKGRNSFDNIVSAVAPDKPVIFLSIDVDCFDLEIFESIEKYLPAVACIEGGQGPHPFDPRMPCQCTGNVGQSLKIIGSVAEKKGYKVICSFQDQFLIKKELLCNFDIDTDLYNLYLNGLKAQRWHIPELHRRLKRLHRVNKILDYLLRETRYEDYNDDKIWVKKNKDDILNVINSLPNYLRNVCTNKYWIMQIAMLNTPKWIFKKFFP